MRHLIGGWGLRFHIGTGCPHVYRTSLGLVGEVTDNTPIRLGSNWSLRDSSPLDERLPRKASCSVYSDVYLVDQHLSTTWVREKGYKPGILTCEILIHFS